MSIIGGLGCFAVLISDIIGVIVVEKHNPLRNTISQLAHGKYAYIQDIGLSLFGIGVIATSVALFIFDHTKVKLKVGSLFLILMAIGVISLAELNNLIGEPGTIIHLVAVGFIAICYFVSMILWISKFRQVSQKWYQGHVIVGTSIIILLAMFKFVPEAYEGAYERLLAIILVGWFLLCNYYLFNLNKL
ncbi:DUF998 domain-containing protein [Aquimarina sp. M1]